MTNIKKKKKSYGKMTSSLTSYALVSGEGAKAANTGQVSTEQPTEYSKTLNFVISNVACEKDKSMLYQHQ